MVAGAEELRPRRGSAPWWLTCCWIRRESYNALLIFAIASSYLQALKNPHELLSSKWRWRHIKARRPIVKALKSVQGFKVCLFFLPPCHRFTACNKLDWSVTNSTPVWDIGNKRFLRIFPTHVLEMTRRKLYESEQATDGGLHGAELSFLDKWQRL